MNDFLGLAIVGAALATIIQLIKAKYGPSSFATKLLVIGLSLLVGAAYYFLSSTAYWVAVLGILAASQAVYALLIKE